MQLQYPTDGDDPFPNSDEHRPGRVVSRYRNSRGSRHYVTCTSCGNGARKWKHVKHRRSCPTHFVKMVEDSERTYRSGKEMNHDPKHLPAHPAATGAVCLR